MRIVVRSTPDGVAGLAASLVRDRIREQPDLVLGLASGRTMVPVYRELVTQLRLAKVSLAAVRVFALDEYRGARPADPGSCRWFLETHLLRHVDVAPANVQLLDGLASDPAAECLRYEAAIRDAGGIDMQLLGIGRNGHIGFNEPGSPFASRTRVAPLSEATREANAPQWGGRAADVPAAALTMGIGTILDARTCLLVAFGSDKAAALVAAIEEPPTVGLPASALQTHGDTVILLDDEAASRLVR